MSEMNRDDLIQALDRAVDGLMSWCVDWHAAVVTRNEWTADQRPLEALRHLKPFAAWFEAHNGDPIVDQPSVRELINLSDRIHRCCQNLTIHETPPNDAAYRAMMSDMRAFIENARRLERAFAAASSDLDSLTGIQNRHAMHRALQHEHDRLSRSRTTSFIALTDLDHFKNVNDQYGHGVGDIVLARTAAVLAEGLRSYDQVFRYGGEEFLILMSDADERIAFAILERLRHAIENTTFHVDEVPELKVTASFGAAPLAHDVNIETTLEYADQALYRAKSDGRNCVHVSKANR